MGQPFHSPTSSPALVPVEPAVNASSARIYFPNLNGLRFLAALLVVIDHTEAFRADVGLRNGWTTPAIPLLGQLGVTLFFVLSGFLITYLLLAEKEKFGRVKFRDFYVRRALRIWPLYYVVVGLALFVLPRLPWLSYPGTTGAATDHLLGKILLYGFMLPNVARELYPPVLYLSQAWSIGVEEQFYVFWPFVIHYGRRYLLLLAGLALAFTVAIQLPWYISSPTRHWVAVTPFWDFLKNFLAALRMQSMCIGGLCAVLLFFRYDTALRIFQAKPMQVTVWLLAIFFSWRGQQFGPLTFEVYSVLYGIIILNLADHTRSLVSFQGAVFNYLGKISYGLYMLHGLAITIAFRVLQVATVDATSLLHWELMYGLALAVSIALAGLSYQYLETPFLKYKKLFMRVESGARI